MINNDQNLIVRFAQNDDDVKSAQRLRYRVFVEELGAKLPNSDHVNLLEIDRFDKHVAHLCLMDLSQNNGDHVVGVYRLINEEIAKDIGGFYSQAEFDIKKITQLTGRKLELGRSCIAPQYRGGVAMAMLWSALGSYVETNQIAYLFGSASFHGCEIDGKEMALANLYHNHLAPENKRAYAHISHKVDMNLRTHDSINSLQAMQGTPSLIKAYLRLGGVIGDGAYIDREFNSIDVFVLMQTKAMVQKYRAMYLK